MLFSAWLLLCVAGVVIFLFACALLNTQDPPSSSTPPPRPSIASKAVPRRGAATPPPDADSRYHQKLRRELELAPDSHDQCPVGYRPVEENTTRCVRNLYWPDPCDRQMQDETAEPCHNFYRYACGAFADDARNRGHDSTFRHLYQSNQRVLHAIIERVAAQQEPDESRLSAFYHSCVQHRDDNLRSATLQLLLGRIDALTAYGSLPRFMGALQLYGAVLPIELSFELDPLNGRRLLPLLQQGGLFAGDTAAVGGETHLRAVAQRMSRLYADEAEAMRRAKQVVAIEQSLAAIRYETEARNMVDYVLESRQFERHDLVDNWRATLAEPMAANGFNLTEFLEGARPSGYSEHRWLWALDSCTLWVRARSYMERLAPLVRTHSLSAWRNYLRHALLFQLVNDGAPRVDSDTHYAYHRAYDARYSLPWHRPRRFLFVEPLASDAEQIEECVVVTEAYLPVLLDNYFLAAELDAETRAAARSIAERVRAQFLDTVRASFAYLSDAERAVAESKIAGVHFQVGAPENWPLDRSALQLDPESFAENVLRVRYFHSAQSYELFASHRVAEGETPLEPDDLFDGLVSVANAFYQHQLNTVTVNAGLLQPPVFSRLYDDVSQMARLGVFVGHELAHALDRIGAQFDEHGALRPWMGREAATEFQARLQCFVDLYSARTQLGNQHDGVRTLNENVADVTGFRVAYAALFDVDREQLPARYRQSSVASSVDRKRQFFLAYAQLYCESLSTQQERQHIAKHAHATGSMRVNNVVTQHEEFAEVWQCAATTDKGRCDVI